MRALFRNAVIGASVLFLASSLFLGGIGEAGGIIMVAVVCTAGISLVGIIPACALVGWILTLIFPFLRPRGESGPGAFGAVRTPAAATSGPPALPSRSCLAIAGYLRQAAEKQVAESEAVERLRREGWREEEIREGQAYLARAGG